MVDCFAGILDQRPYVQSGAAGHRGKKIECARKFFAEINHKIAPGHVKYDVVTSYGKLMEIVGGKTVPHAGGTC